jgi:HEAT repeat protein
LRLPCPTNEAAIRELVRQAHRGRVPSEKEELLIEIGTGNNTVIRELVRQLETTQDKNFFWRGIWFLVEIGMGNETAIQELVRLLETTQDEDFCLNIAHVLGTIDPGNETAIQELVRLLETTQDEDFRWCVADGLNQIDPSNEMAIRVLVQASEMRSRFSRFWSTQLEKLASLDLAGNKTVIQELVRLLETTQDTATYTSAVNYLGKLGIGNEIAIQALIRLLRNQQNDDIRWRNTEFSPTNNIHLFTAITAINLGIIDPRNEIAIRELERLLESTQDETSGEWIARGLGEIDPGNEIAIRELVRLIKRGDSGLFGNTAYRLGKIDPGNKIAIRELERLLGTTKDWLNLNFVLESLDEIGTHSERSRSVLVRSLRHHLREEKAYQLMMKCAETLSYPKFFQAFHSRR